MVPAFDQEHEIEANIREIERRVADLGVTYEIVVVSDGSSDGTLEAASRAAGPSVRVTGYPENMGKGHALCVGSGLARGRYVAWCDSDLDLDPASLATFLEILRATDADIVVGSKRHPDSRVAYPRHRRVASWMFQRLVHALFRLNVRDTQVGMKLLTRPVVDRVLPIVLVKRFAVDLEVLAVSRALGLDRIVEAPIALNYQFTASGVNWRAVGRALWDTAAVFYRLRIRRYYQKQAAGQVMPGPTAGVPETTASERPA